ncbi:MAG: arsenite S-adenosylmethyltransferase, partial [Mycobacterium sp.]
MTDNPLREQVRERYAAAAAAVTGGTDNNLLTVESCCGPSRPTQIDDIFGAALYRVSDQSELPAQAVAASLGCGNPTA